MLLYVRFHLIILIATFVSVGAQLATAPKLTDHLSGNDAFLISDVVQREMKECNLLVLFGDERRLGHLMPIFFSFPNGVTLIDFSKADSLHPIVTKKAILESDANLCINYLVLYEKQLFHQMVDVGELFWEGEQKIFIVAADRSDEEDMEKLLYHPVFRKCPKLLYASNPSTSYFWNIFILTVYSGTKRSQIQRINVWSTNFKFKYENPLFPSGNLQTFNQYDFSVAALPYSPFVIARNLSTDGPMRYRGLEIDILNVIATYANFTYHYIAPEDGQWGKQLKDGSWTGMIGMVGREEADFAISDIAPSVHRLKVVDFCDIFVFDASELITPKAKPLPLWQGPIRPFGGEVWVAIVVACLASSLFIFSISSVVSINRRDKWFRSFSNCLIYTILPLFMRCSKTDYKASTGRLFISIWLLMAMIISIFYTSSLTSFLILPGTTKPIESLEQLVTSEIGWAKVDFGGLQNEMLEKASDPTLKALGRGVEWRNDLDGILREVVKGKIATWENSITAHLKVAVQYSDKNGQPLVHFTGYALLQERISWPIQKTAPFKRRFNILTNRVVESGLVKKFIEDIILEEQKLQKSKMSKDEEVANLEEQSIPTVLTIDHFQGPFFFILVGYFIATATMTCELIVQKLKNIYG